MFRLSTGDETTSRFSKWTKKDDLSRQKRAAFLTGTTETGENTVMDMLKRVYGSDYNEIIADYGRQKRAARDVATLAPLLDMLTARKGTG